jgi:hypothetical protein
MRSRSHHAVETATAIRYNDDDLPPVDVKRETELRRFASDTILRRAQTADIAPIRRKLRSSARGHLEQAAAQVRGRENERLSDSDFASFRKGVDRAIIELDQEARLADFEHHAAVVNEPGPYRADSPNSYYADLAAAASARLAVPDVLGARISSDVDMSAAAVQERLRRHSVDVALAIRRGGEYGRKAKAILGESFREADPVQHRQRMEKELRGLPTGGGATASAAGGGGAAFVSPAFVLDAWAPFRGIERSFADQCRAVSLSQAAPFGMNIYVPLFSGADKVAKQAEEGTVTETVPTAELEGAKLETLTGQVIISRQLLDRALLGGGFDELLFTEMR